MMDIKAGDVRLKSGQARIAVRNDRGNIDYIGLDVKMCWQTTWGSWGKKTDQIILEAGGKFYAVTVAEVAA
jgi:hypothetical protein